LTDIYHSLAYQHLGRLLASTQNQYGSMIEKIKYKDQELRKIKNHISKKAHIERYFYFSLDKL
jgi:hypothetical protein